MMKHSLFHKTGMYILSMWLLALIVIILSLNLPMEFGWDSYFIGFKEMIIHPCLTVIFLIIFLLGIFYYFILTRGWLTGTQQFHVKILKISSKQSDPLAFLASYFVPLVSFQLQETSHELVLVLLFLVIGIMYVKGGLFHLNPTLILCGFKMYNVEYAKDGDSHHVIAISKSALAKGDRI